MRLICLPSLLPLFRLRRPEYTVNGSTINTCRGGQCTPEGLRDRAQPHMSHIFQAQNPGTLRGVPLPGSLMTHAGQHLLLLSFQQVIPGQARGLLPYP